MKHNLKYDNYHILAKCKKRKNKSTCSEYTKRQQKLLKIVLYYEYIL